eukprot:TCALIF_01609-PB protein Name:"Protein of unknown function" AED:0.75 eAED:1.00 QI:0/0/0/0.5/1/1/2/0/63
MRSYSLNQSPWTETEKETETEREKRKKKKLTIIHPTLIISKGIMSPIRLADIDKPDYKVQGMC